MAAECPATFRRIHPQPLISATGLASIACGFELFYSTKDSERETLDVDIGWYGHALRYKLVIENEATFRRIHPRHFQTSSKGIYGIGCLSVSSVHLVSVIFYFPFGL